MMVTTFIQEKKEGLSHRAEDIEAFVHAYSRDEIPDYQVAAWLMAVCLKGMTAEETVALTEAMVHSGRRLNWKTSSFLPVDKHSTGGIGDKTSLIIAPLVASFGIPVPMMAGRGLGFTGGTLDKLESIPGFQTRRPLPLLERQMEKDGFFLVGQTDEICPADKRMYALRDVTSTVDCLPLICASILSKKIAEGAKALVMDVKVGSGAFMASASDASDLAHALIEIGRKGGLTVRALITDMNQPLGRFVGNALEVKECLEILRAEESADGFKNHQDTLDLSVELAARMLVLSGYEADLEKARKKCFQKIWDGSAYASFEKLAHAQGGDLAAFSTRASHQAEIKAARDGFLHFTSNRHVGIAALMLGGGRMKQTDVLDLHVGVEVLGRQGQAVKAGDVLFRLHFNDPGKQKAAEENLSRAFTLTDQPPAIFPLIHKELT